MYLEDPCKILKDLGKILESLKILWSFQWYPRTAHALLPNVLAGLLEGALVTFGGSVWADHLGFLSPCHGGCDLGKWLYLPVPLGPSLPLATWAWTLVFSCYNFVRKTAFFFPELVKIITSSLISKCHITFLLGHSVIGYPCFASHSYPQKHGRKKIMTLRNFALITDHFNFILLEPACQRHFFFFVGLSNHNVPWPGC